MDKSEPPQDFWKTWWDEQARKPRSDYQLNRGTTLRLAALEARERAQFLQAVDPQPQDILLDAGCGSGPNISLLSPQVREIVGVDYSPEMVRRAEERAQHEKLANVKLLQGDVTALPFPADTFDKVVCASVLQYLDNEHCARALREMIRVCKPNGRLVLHIKNGTSLYGLSLKILRPIARLMGKKMKPEYYRSRGWHVDIITQERGTVDNFEGFGLLTFVPLPQRLVGILLNCEIHLPLPKFLKKLTVNHKLTVVVNKRDAGPGRL